MTDAASVGRRARLTVAALIALACVAALGLSKTGTVNSTAMERDRHSIAKGNGDRVAQAAEAAPKKANTRGRKGGARGDARGKRGRKGGAWSWCTHLRRYGTNFDLGLASFLAHQLAPLGDALEFGAGLGLYVRYLVAHGRVPGRVVGIEPEDMAAAGAFRGAFGDGGGGGRRPTQLRADVGDAAAFDAAADALGPPFDLVFSIEVAEHLRPELLPRLVAFLARQTGRYLVFGAAPPGQGGTGHIPASQRTREEWIAAFEAAGLVFMPKLSALLLQQCDDQNGHHKRNPFVMARPGLRALDSGVLSPNASRSASNMSRAAREQRTYALFPSVRDAVKRSGKRCKVKFPPE